MQGNHSFLEVIQVIFSKDNSMPSTFRRTNWLRFSALFQGDTISWHVSNLRLLRWTKFTTGNSRFVACHMHSAKPKKHSAKDLPSITLNKQHITSTVPANGSLPSVFYRALGKDFVESWNRRSAKKSNVTEWRRSRRVCRVSNLRHSANLPSLPSVKF